MSKILIFAADEMSFYKFRKELISALKADGFETYFCAPFGTYTEMLENLGCIPIDVPLSRRGINVLEDLRLYGTYKRIIKMVRPSIILTYTLKPRVYGNIASDGIPCLNTITGMGSFYPGNIPLTMLTSMMDRVGLARTSHIIFQNEESKNLYLGKKMKRGMQYSVIQGSGVNLDEFSFEALASNNNSVLSFFGRIMKDKGIEELLIAAERIKTNPQFQNVNFRLYGSLEENYRDLIMQYEKNGVVEYKGFVDDVRPYLKESDCIVLPSYHEGMSNSLLEAAAVGRPIITTNIPGCREAVDDLLTGFLCQPRDQDSLYHAIKTFLELPVEARAELGRKGRLKMEMEFDRRDVIAEYIKVIRELINEEARWNCS